MTSLNLFPVLDGKPFEVASGEIVNVINPATSEAIGQQKCCSHRDVDAVVQYLFDQLDEGSDETESHE